MNVPQVSPADRLRGLLKGPGIITMPCCFDAWSARLVERAGFSLSFMSGFAVSAARFGLPDTGLVSYGEMLDAGRAINAAVSIPVIGDGDTGYGNALNVRRTVNGYAGAGFAAVMIEDQVAPKRCGHTQGKQVVDRDEALMRVRAAVDAREAGADILILARTDARAVLGLEEALTRARAFEDLGADILFVEAPMSEDEMAAICKATSRPNLANMLEGGVTPMLTPKQLEEIGFSIAAYPLALLAAATGAIEAALGKLAVGAMPSGVASFAHIRDIAGFPEYVAAEKTYAAPDAKASGTQNSGTEDADEA
ncbi:MAG: 2-methylisocitrate lyase-like PEP mutase family enzyme [Alphaproteobacteria bacterium]|jgi:2-methylisocitrate lyase-like PEP mutase family enzyme